jgi:hypothetical protein
MPDRFACTAPLLGGEDRKNVRDEVVDLISRCLPFVSIVASEGDSSDKFGVQCVALNADLTDPDVTNAIATELAHAAHVAPRSRDWKGQTPFMCSQTSPSTPSG